MRNRYYDPRTGRFTQEDPAGLGGGLNLYGFAAGDPVNFSDPFGLCPLKKDGIPCTIYLTAYGKAHGASLDALQPSSWRSLNNLAEKAGHNLGINATSNGTHDDPRHNGQSACCFHNSNTELSGLAVDVGEVDHHTVGSSEASAGVDDVERTALGMGDVKAVIDPNGYWASSKPNGSMRPVNDPETTKKHNTHMHISFWADWEETPQ